MKILAFSDLHDTISAVEELYRRVKNIKFDCILFAGDFGKLETAKRVAEMFSSMSAPFLYVQGNRDRFDYSESIGENAVHLHLKAVRMENYTVLGYSGLASFSATSRQKRERETRKIIKRENIREKELILVSHERIGNLQLKPLMHIFGHLHKNYHTITGNTHFVNVAQIDTNTTKNNGGRYAIIDIKGHSASVDFYSIS